ncbi:hypothetical protein [Luteimonas sp. MC1828]|uniref:hypothetical protein n=1 Tax=Luteimonas sp. MC1828 TaxID=2799787 RepID=UPI0018F1251F|nr:hypothetical protein [Luteimonas sp. MC1828]MBJ7575479.1 hypothetical protein [Luteimonas sp. MC1828]
MEESREFEHPVAQRLADLAGVERDLELAKEACDLFLGMPHVGSREAIALSNAVGGYALVTYFRTIGSGARSGITADQVAGLTPALQKVHERLKAVRSHYVTHSVNQQEQNKVTVALNADGSLSSLGTEHSRPATFSAEQILALKQLIEGIAPLISAEYDFEWERVWDHLESLSPEARKQALTSVSRGKPLDWRLKQRRFRT